MSDPESSILVVEDDPAVREALERALGFEGYEIETARDGAIALSMLRDHTYDLIVLDVMMPHLDGLETCRRIRAGGDDVPVLMLTAATAVDDRVEGLDAGADDYVAKPFALDELLARIRALLRRSTGGVSTVMKVGDLVIDPGARTAIRGGRHMNLTKTEFDLLHLLGLTPGIVLSRERIYDEVWGIDFATTSNSLDVYVGYLRRKTEAGGESRIIQTVRGVGYVLRTEA
ncbi:MAG: response regulator transcription factor [Acidimicrobiia bacterium]|nr:MAG: response regulator transcription factor [Acidimicrobiia bacterium]